MKQHINKRKHLAEIAEKLVSKPFHGKLPGTGSNLAPLISHFPRGPKDEFEDKWCAAFVYHCCILAGFEIPPRHPEPVSVSFGAVRAWLVWAKLPGNKFYFSARNPKFNPEVGDIVIYDRVFEGKPHDHIGIVIGVREQYLICAEGNVNNVSAVTKRLRNRHIRGFIRIPNTT